VCVRAHVISVPDPPSWSGAGISHSSVALLYQLLEAMLLPCPACTVALISSPQ
jgi:hypothetical protein